MFAFAFYSTHPFLVRIHLRRSNLSFSFSLFSFSLIQIFCLLLPSLLPPFFPPTVSFRQSVPHHNFVYSIKIHDFNICTVSSLSSLFAPLLFSFGFPTLVTSHSAVVRHEPHFSGSSNFLLTRTISLKFLDLAFLLSFSPLFPSLFSFVRGFRAFLSSFFSFRHPFERLCVLILTSALLLRFFLPGRPASSSSPLI